jgi:hypothetical protein
VRRALLVAVAAIVAYHNALFDRFVLDDYHYVLENPSLRPANVPALFWRAYESGGAAFYRPLATATFALDRAAFHTWAAGFHAHNLVWHVVACVALFALLRRLTADDAAMAGALIFAVHPIHTEAVTGIVGRTEVMATAFALLGIVAHLEGKKRAALYALAALLCKESGVFCAAAAVLLDAWRSHDPRGALRRGVIFLVPLVAYALLRAYALGGAQLQESDAVFHLTTPWGGFCTALDAAGRSLRLLVVPAPLVADYSYAAIPPAGGFGVPALLGVLTITTPIAIGVLVRKRAPLVGLGVAIALVAYLPTSNFVVHLPILMAERFLYAPSVGLALVTAALFALAPRRAGWLLVGAVALTGTALTLARNTDWETPLSLWQDTVEKQPKSGLAHGNLALSCLTVGDRACALRELRLAVELNPYRDDFSSTLRTLERSPSPPAVR